MTAQKDYDYHLIANAMILQGGDHSVPGAISSYETALYNNNAAEICIAERLLRAFVKRRQAGGYDTIKEITAELYSAKAGD